jgi:flagellar hook-basal body complex protein FliE
MRTERADVNQLLQQMKQMQSQLHEQRGLRDSVFANGPGAIKSDGINGLNNVGNVEGGAKVPGFNDLFKQAVNSVNDTQQQAGALATSYEKGDTGVSLAQVMVASQKASVSFQALTQVRNRLVDAYKDIMNMPL